MKDLCEMSIDELRSEFEIYASETGLDREFEYDYEESFESWLEENEIELNDE